MSAGKPRSIKSGEELLGKYREFCNSIIESNYTRLPTRSNFAAWEGIDRKTIYWSLEKYYPAVKKEIISMMGDLLVQGAALGKWNATTIIFALKNWCGWSDRAEVQNTNVNVDGGELDYDERMKLIERIKRAGG